MRLIGVICTSGGQFLSCGKNNRFGDHEYEGDQLQLFTVWQCCINLPLIDCALVMTLFYVKIFFQSS